MRALRLLRRVLSWSVFLALVLGWTVYLRPPVLGGSTSYVFVKGTSMEPTYHTGDLVLVRRKARYEVGDIAAFRAMSSMGDTVVIHRVIDELDGGAYQLQGDNRDVPDPWHPTGEQIVGSPLLLVPAAGRIAVQLAASPLLLGAVAGGMAATAVIVEPAAIGAWLGRRLRRPRPTPAA